MNRKLIKQANQAYTITLPIEWIRTNKLSSGDEVTLELQENTIIIKGKQKIHTGKVRFDFSGFTSRQQFVYLGACYALGVDEISAKINAPTNTNQMLGYAILEEKKNEITIKDISGISQENLHEIFKRTFQMLLSFYNTALEDILGNQTATTKDVEKRDGEVNKFTFFLQRAVMKQQLHSTEGKVMFACAFLLEQIGDEINRVWREQNSSYRKLEKIAMLSQQALEKAFAIYYQDTPTLVKDLHIIKEKIRNEARAIVDKNNAFGVIRMIKIAELASDITPLSIMRRIKVV